MVVNWAIAEAALLLAPGLSYLLFRRTKSNASRDRRLVISGATICSVGVVGAAVDLSFTALELNFVYFALAYFSVCFLFWHVLNISAPWLRRVLVIAGLLPIALGLFLSTVGMLAVGFMVGDIEPEQRLLLTSNLTAETYAIGNTTTDYRGSRVAVYDRSDVLPFVERTVIDTTYLSLGLYGGKPLMEYDIRNSQLLIKSEWRKHIFRDTIHLRSQGPSRR